MLHGCRHRDCKDGKDGMRVVEATSTTIVIYDVFHLKENPAHFKDWSPLRNIKPNNGKDKISTVLLHPDLNIVFWATNHGVVGAYDFQNENLIRRVHLPQLRKNSNAYYIPDLIFSIVLNMLVFHCSAEGKRGILTWTLNDEHVERISGFEYHGLCDLHNDQVQLLVKKRDSLAICDLRQRKELHRWQTKDKNDAWISDAKYSCDSELVYASFQDCSIGVFDATACLQLRCRITSSAYSPHVQWPEIWQIVAHPQKRNQFAIRMWGNRVYVIDPSHELGGEWVCKAT